MPSDACVHYQGVCRWRGRKMNRRWVGRGSREFLLLTLRARMHLTYRPWKGICVTGYTALPGFVRPDFPPGHFEYPDMKKRTSAPAPGGGRHLAPMESEYLAALQSLVEHCALRQYDDGDQREPGWLTIKTQGAAWCVVVKDPATCTTFTAVGATLDKALETAALLLACDDAPWEPDVWMLKQASMKKK